VDLQAWQEIGAQPLKSWTRRTKRNPIDTDWKERQWTQLVIGLVSVVREGCHHKWVLLKRKECGVDHW